MRISISYPPILNERGQKAMVSQNRNVQFFKKPTYLLPVIHAQAATGLRDDGHEVYWDDGNAQLKTFDKWYTDLIQWKPDIVVFEGTTPVMNFYWELTRRLRVELPSAVFIMTGYHSMRRPEETLSKAPFDVILRSNNIDFVLRRLVFEIAQNPFWRMSTGIEGLTIRTSESEIRSTGNFVQVEPLDQSPLIDRDLVQWKKYAYENGNFLQVPGTYATSVIRDCVFGKCTFCRYNGPELTFSMMSVNRSLDEYEDLINNYGVREIFDDSGVWYRGREARQFAQGIIERGLHKSGCYFGINTRFEYLDEETIELLARANFRFVLLGFEAADDATLQRLNKGYQMEHVEKCLTWMTKYGLHPHLTIMVGYYWQTKEQLDLTVKTVRDLMFRGLARTLQVTICTPLDFTPYHQECINEGVLLVDDYDDHDMSRVIVKTPIPHEEYYRAIKRMYAISFHPRFLLRQIIFLRHLRKRDWQFLFTYGTRALRRVRQHIFNLTSRAPDTHD
jgi:anaerobic magnesium-protoporphyrin IX monomethyl ester cyclase